MQTSRSAFAHVILAVLALSAFCWAQTPVLVTQAVDNSVRTTLVGNVHPLARPQFDQGEVPASTTLHRMMLVLKRSDQQETALRRLIENQQYKKSPSYHQWLTPEEFGRQFGLADSDLAAVVAWLTASGFVVNHVSNGRTVIEFDGTAGLVKQAFGTALHRYDINGEEHIANSTDPSIPTALAPVIVGVRSLHNFFPKPQNVFIGTYSQKTKQLKPAHPEYTFTGPCGITGTQDCYALGPYDFANIYDVIPLWTAASPINGSGVNIAIVGQTDINPDDATTFWGLFGLGQNGVPMPTLTVYTNGPDPGFTGDEPEADVDAQWSGSVAPGATIHFVTSATTETDAGIDLSAIYIVDNNLAPIMSESYGICEAGAGSAGVGFYGTMWEQAAAQGISVMVASGDSGAAGCDEAGSTYAIYGENVNAIASTPWNAAIGGTDFNQFNAWSTYWNAANNATTQQSVKNNTYIPETTWDDSCTNPLFQLATGGSSNPITNCNNANFSDFLYVVGGGGGRSNYSGGAVLGYGWETPTWQTGIPNKSDDVRDLPDVSLFASDGFLSSFYVICQSDVNPGNGSECTLNDLLGFGGTSFASPTFAGIMALVNQKNGGPQGVPGLILYTLAGKEPTAFHDINTSTLNGTVNATTTNSVPCAAGSTADCTASGSDKYGVLAGWSTGAGYDLATGLGSVDAANLVNNWGKVTFTPTTSTLTLNNGNPISGITHGTGIPVTVSVVSSSATGDVSLLVGPKPGTPSIDWNTLSGGTVTWTTTLLPGGTYDVIAHYAGDTTYGGSYSAPSANITINPENSSVYMPGVVTGIDANGNPVYATSVTYGTGGFGPWENVCGFQLGCTYGYWLRADVQNSQGQFCTSEVLGEIACPTGTIAFTDNGNALDGGTFKLNSLGYTEDQGIQLTVGSHTLAASYSGDASYKTSSTTVGITVGPDATVLANVALNPSTVNATQNFTATVTVTTPTATTSYGAAPTGTVTFLANGTALTGTVSYTPTTGNPSTGLPATLAATLTTSISTPGTYTITATYTTGDGNYSSQSSSNSASLVVTSNQNVSLGTPTTPASAEPGQGTMATMQVSTSDSNAFASNPSFQCSNLPTGATCSFSPSTLQGLSSPQTVTITVSTAGPFTGTAGGVVPAGHTAKPTKRSAQNQTPRLWLPLGLPLAGVVFFGLGGSRIRRRYQIAGLFLMLVLAAFLVACGGGSSSSSPPVVTVSPTSASLWPDVTGFPTSAVTQQFSASVSNTTSQSVTWAVNGTTGGNSTVGTISSSGLYTAPATSPGTAITVTATSPLTSTPGSATVTLGNPTPAGTFTVTVTGTEGTQTPQTTTFSLTVVD